MTARVLFVSLELLGPIFSGNGTYSRSLVRALKKAGLEVAVLSGRREDVNLDLQDGQAKDEILRTSLVIDIPIPVSRWGKLDVGSGWREFEAGCRAARVAGRVQEFAPDVVFVVDWHGHLAWRALTASQEGLSKIPTIWLNYRVFSMATLTDEEASFYRQAEGLAARSCSAAVALCRSDVRALVSLANAVDPSGKTAFDPETGLLLTSAPVATAPPTVEAISVSTRFFILLPALRSDVAELASKETASPVRPFLSCCVRLSPEKQPHRFAALLEGLSQAANEADDGAAEADACLGRIVPFLCGSAGDKDYAEKVRAAVESYRPKAASSTSSSARPKHSDLGSPELLATILPSDTSGEEDGLLPPSIVDRSFLTASDMARIFSRSLLNCHPCDYDAYGMTVVEAAAFGCPTLVAGSSKPRDVSDASSASDTIPALQFAAGAPGLPGFLRVLKQEAGTASPSSSASSYPTVGAIDLLGEPMPLPTAMPLPATTEATNACALGFPWADMDAPAEDGRSRATCEQFLLPLLRPEAAALIAKVGENARAKALSWTENELSRALAALVEDVIRTA